MQYHVCDLIIETRDKPFTVMVDSDTDVLLDNVIRSVCVCLRCPLSLVWIHEMLPPVLMYRAIRHEMWPPVFMYCHEMWPPVLMYHAIRHEVWPPVLYMLHQF